MKPPDFGRSVNPISTKGGRLCPPNNTGTPGFSDLPTALICKGSKSLMFEFLFKLAWTQGCFYICSYSKFSKAFPKELTYCLYIYSISLQDKQLNHNTADGVILTNRSLVLQGIDRTRSGGYTCQALNAVGSGQSQVIELDVKCKTFIYYTQ